MQIITSVMWLLLFTLLTSLLYMIVFIFPKKFKIMRDIGKNMTNDEFIQLAKAGNAEAKALLRKSKIVYWILISSGVLLILLNHLFRK